MSEKKIREIKKELPLSMVSPNMIKEEVADRILTGGWGALEPFGGHHELATRLGVDVVKPGKKNLSGYRKLKIEFDEMIGNKHIGRDMAGDSSNIKYRLIVVMHYKEIGDGKYSWLVESSKVVKEE